MSDKLLRAFGLLSADVKSMQGDIDLLNTVRPIVKHGKDGISPKIEDIVEAVLAQIPTPKNGESPDPKAVVADVLAIMPKPQPGRDAPPVNVSDVAAIVLAKIPKPIDGASPELSTIVKEVLAKIPKPKDGVGPTPEAVSRVMPRPKDGKDGVSVTDVQLRDNDLFVFLDGKKKKAGRIKVPTPTAPFNPGAGGGGGARGGVAPQALKITTHLFTFSTLDSQNPTGLGFINARQTSLGPAQTGVVSLDADGTVTINKVGGGIFTLNARLQAGREGSSGTALLLFRITVNGVQVGTSAALKKTDLNDTSIVNFVRQVFLPEGAQIRLEVMRDPSGVDAGGLRGNLNTDEGAGTWNSDRCAVFTVSEIELIG